MQGRPFSEFPEAFPLDAVVGRLRDVPGVAAVTLGGSWAAGRARPTSDVDLGIYYRPSQLIDIAAIRDVAEALNDTPNPVVTGLGEWGPWVNGGAWLTIGGRRTDFLYRDLDLVSQTIDECIAGKTRADYWQQPPFGFHSQIYCAEIRVARSLFDPHGVIAGLKERVAAYPLALKRRQVGGFLWSAQFTLNNGQKALGSGEPYLVVGFLLRAVTEMVQALYGLNETYFMNDKYIYRDIAEFGVKPIDFLDRIDRIVSGPTDVPSLTERFAKAVALRAEIEALAGDLYTPRF